MLRILLVDDETTVTETLAATLPWEELGIGEVHQAASGFEALELLDRQPVDIVISDIKMPEMSGIELLEQISLRRYPIRTILLSGYAEFEYARQALKYQTVQYLVKPVHDDQLIGAIRQAADQVRSVNRETEMFEQAGRMMRENLPMLRQMLLHELLHGQAKGAALVEQLRQYELPLADGDAVEVLLVRIDGTKDDWSDASLLYFAVANVALNLFASPALCHCRDEHGYIALLLKTAAEGDGTPAADEAANGERDVPYFQECVRSYLKTDISIVIGGRGRFPDDLPALYQSCLASLRMTMLSERGLILKAQSASELPAIPVLSAIYEPPALMQLLEEGRFDDARAKLDAAYAELKAQEVLLKEHLIEFFFHAVGTFIHISHKYDLQFSKLMDRDFGQLLSGDTLLRVDRLADYCNQVFDLLVQEMEAKKKGTRSFLIRQAQSFIERHLDSDVSLQAIADHVHMHPVYLSQLYKAECGEGIKEYVMRLRLEKAAHLLKTTNLKIGDIARDTGYQNTSYFIRVFRKHFAQTPQEFRDALL